MARPSLSSRIQRPIGPGYQARPRPLAMPLDAIRPMIRIAHRATGPIRIAERIIFDHELVLIVKGHGTLQCREGGVDFAPHDLLFIPPFVPHGFVASGAAAAEHLAIHFDFSPDQPRLAWDPHRRRPYAIVFPEGIHIPSHLRLDPADGLEALFARVVSAWERDDERGRLTAQAHFHVLIAHLLDTPAASPATPGDVTGPSDLPSRGPEAGPQAVRVRIDRALEVIRERYTEEISNDDLARASGMSPSRLSHHFRLWTGYTPADYLRRVRLAHARTALRNVDLSIKAIAHGCGFQDQYHFSRVFHRVVGVSPSEYREAVLAGGTSITWEPGPLPGMGSGP